MTVSVEDEKRCSIRMYPDQQGRVAQITLTCVTAPTHFG